MKSATSVLAIQANTDRFSHPASSILWNRLAPSGTLVLLACLCLPAHAQTAQFSGTQSNVVSYLGIVSLSSPNSFYTAGVAVDGSGNVYIAHGCYSSPSAPPDSYPDCTVWKETPSGNGYTQSSIIIGVPYSPTNPSFTVPGQVAVDSQGNVYVTDNHYLTTGYPNTVWKETPSAVGYTTSVVASLPAGSLAFGVAVDASGNVYWSDAVNGNVWKETLSGGSYTQSLLAGGFGYPDGIAVDSNNNVYIADSGASGIPPMVWKETPSAGGYTATTVTTGLTAPAGVTVDASGNVYVSNNGIYKETLSAGTYTQTMVPIFTPGYAYGTLNLSNQIALDSSGNLYIADTGNQRTVKEMTSGNFGSANVGSTSPAQVTAVFSFNEGSTLGAPALLTQGVKGLDFADAGTGTCKSGSSFYPENICAVVVNFTPTAPGARYGAVELLDNSSNALASGYLQGTGVGPQINFLPGVQSALGSGLNDPWGVAVDASGNVFVADRDNNAVKEILAAGGYTTVNTLGSGFSQPVNVAVDGSGNVFVADAGNSAVKEILAAGGYTTVNTLGSGFNEPFGVAVDGIGNVFVADSSNSEVKEILAAGGYTTVNYLGGGFWYPAGVAVDGSGNVFVADQYNNAVKEILAASGYTTVNTLGSGFSDPAGVAVDGSGNVFVADLENNAVKEIVAASGYTTIDTLGSGFGQPMGVAVDGHGNIFVADHANSNSVVKLDYVDAPALSFATTLAGSTSSDSPQTVVVRNEGNAILNFSALSYPVDFPEKSGIGTDCKATSVVAVSAGCTLSIDFSPKATSLTSSPTVLSELVDLTTNSLNASTVASVQVGGTGVPETSAAMATPTPSSTLMSTSVTFDWSAPGGATGYLLHLGSTGVGSSNLDSSGKITGNTVTFSSLPANGETIYARLFTYYGTASVSVDYTYTAITATAATLTTPAPSSTFTSNTVTFGWSAVSGATKYLLELGTTGVGSSNVYTSGGTTGTTATATGLPGIGETVYARLFTYFGTTAVSADFTYTDVTQSTLTIPTPGSTFTSTNVTFDWTAATGATKYLLHLGTTGVGSSNVYSSGGVTGTTATAVNLPGNGETIYVRLYTYYGTAYATTDYTYTDVTQSSLTTPTPSSTFTSTSVTFDWKTATGATKYLLHLGSTGVGSSNLDSSGQIAGTTFTFSSLPSNGETIYARLFTYWGTAYAYSDYTYTALTATAATLNSPTPGSTLVSPSTTFGWTAVTGTTKYLLELGTTGVGSSNLYNSGGTTGTTATANNLPGNGETIYARLYTYFGTTSVSADSTYTDVTQSVLTTPTPGSAFTSTSVTFDWTTATGATKYLVHVGSTGVGSSNLDSSGQITGTTVTFTGLPNNGEAIYVRLYTYFGTASAYTDYTYTAQ